MPRIDHNLVPVVIDLERGLRQLGMPFGIVGALVPELLLTARPRRMTNDADATVVVDNLADFNVRARRCRRPVNSGQPFHGGRQWPLRCGEATIPIGPVRLIVAVSRRPRRPRQRIDRTAHKRAAAVKLAPRVETDYPFFHLWPLDPGLQAGRFMGKPFV